MASISFEKGRTSMRIEQLKYLISIADSGSISRSSRMLNISQQGLSQTVHQLEKELGVKLLFREGNHTRLTAAGKLLRGDIENILQSCENIYSLISKDAPLERETKQRCRVCATPNFCILVLPAVIQRMSRLFHRLELSVTEAKTTELLGSDDLSQALYMISCPERLIPRLLEKPEVLGIHEFSRVPIQAVVSRTHPAAKAGVVTADDLCRCPLVLLSSDDLLLHHLLGSRFREAHILLHTTNFELYQSAAFKKDAVSLTVPLAGDRRIMPGFCSVPLENTETIVYGYIVNKYSQSSAVAREVLNMTESEVVKMLAAAPEQ